MMSTNPAVEPIGQSSGRAIPQNDPRWTRLHRIVEEQSLLRGTFTLTSGRTSNYLFQMRQTALHPEGAHLIGEIIVGFMRQQGIKCAGGLELGAVPVVTAVASASFRLGYPVEAFFIRKSVKAHGAQERIDGYVADGEEILAVDDVTTTGGSIIRTLQELAKEHRCPVKWAFSLLDREEGAQEELARQGIRLVSIFRTSDFEI